MNEPIYRIRNVKQEYQERCVLQVEQLDIYPGEIFTIVGPSGAGKSTLLRLLNFLESPSSGSIYYGKHKFNSNTEIPLQYRRQVVTVFQSPMMLNRSVHANVQYGLKLRGDKDSDQRVKKALEQVGLQEFATQRAALLSGGEAQRVALARAMVLSPRVLLLDEPTANLDPYNVKILEDAILKLNRHRDTTIVLVTHNIFQAKRLAQRVAFLMSGEIIEVSEAETFFSHPDDSRTAAFVRGEMIF
jgi:tungstate transport system ATP-binding protein